MLVIIRGLDYKVVKFYWVRNKLKVFIHYCLPMSFKKETEGTSTADSLSISSFTDGKDFNYESTIGGLSQVTQALLQSASFKKKKNLASDYMTFGNSEQKPLRARPRDSSPPVPINQENLPSLSNGGYNYDHEETITRKGKKKQRSSMLYGDRYIPSRKGSKFSQYIETPAPAYDMSSNQTALEMLYKQQILQQAPEIDENTVYNCKNTLKFNVPQTYIDQLHPNNKLSPLIPSKYFTVSEDTCMNYSKFMRKIPKVPFKVLDAPALQDDFYLNLIDWSNQNVLSVALSQCVYLWSAQSSKVTKLLDLGQSDQVTSVAWSLQGPLMSVGTNSGEVQIWDAVKLKKVRSMKGHQSRVGTLCFSQNLLSSGSRDKNILQRDIRGPSQYLWKQSAHKQEVCGLKWSPDSQILASGGNDNKLYLWSTHSSANPICKFSEHQAAVKAIAWSPHQHGLLASGGGTADRTIRFWNALEGRHLMKEDTGSQVCNLIFSKRDNEIISTHGYSQNQIVLWKSREMKRIATLTGHTYRVLYLAMSPDGQTIVTGAGDETLRFWNIYPGSNKDEEEEAPISQLGGISLR